MIMIIANIIITNCNTVAKVHIITTNVITTVTTTTITNATNTSVIMVITAHPLPHLPPASQTRG
ncbi:hypothetical protein E2C01_043100 [Portunus trituberculatus]|uniref:Uncharacterized protein n=1 Tax=Portunus trituberculatus TaxID=210409 RepID=A0A5B7FS08_PORTR|nr:hypothetical protein [Portunus trituberculatus]